MQGYDSEAAFPTFAVLKNSFTMRLNVIVPCYNPAPGWEQVLAQHFAEFTEELGRPDWTVQLVVANDGSVRNAEPSNFARLSELIPNALVVSYAENRGKGYALRQGVAAHEADFFLVTDTDFPYTYETMVRVLDVLEEKGGIAAGNRDTTYYESVPPFRRKLSKSLRWLLRNVLRQPIDDSQCGLKAFDNAGRTIFLETSIDRFLFDLEFLMLATGRVPVNPVPVQLREGVVFSKVGWAILATEGRNFLWLLFKQIFRIKN
jgi:glycosyltransferase involved in cell wall biosynthesis